MPHGRSSLQEFKVKHPSITERFFCQPAENMGASPSEQLMGFSSSLAPVFQSESDAAPPEQSSAAEHDSNTFVQN